MIIVLKKGSTEKERQHVIDKIEEVGLKTQVSIGEERVIIGVIGDEAKLESVQLKTLAGVENVMPILKPYKVVSRESHPENSVFNINGVEVGGKKIQIIAGPCSVETQENLTQAALEVKKSGATMLRGGAFKPRTSPYSFQGLGEEGLKFLREASKASGLPVVTELMDPRDLDLMGDYVDVIQIGARNIQNFRLLLEVGRQDKPVLLKRGLSTTIKEFLMSAEYIASQGNTNIILCERGIRTFETATRNTLDITAIPVLKKETHLPVFIDPSHSAGSWEYVDPLSKASIAAGCDGLLIEVHIDPENALCDGAQSLMPSTFDRLMKDLKPIAEAVGRTI